MEGQWKWHQNNTSERPRSQFPTWEVWNWTKKTRKYFVKRPCSFDVLFKIKLITVNVDVASVRPKVIDWRLPTCFSFLFPCQNLDVIPAKWWRSRVSRWPSIQIMITSNMSTSASYICLLDQHLSDYLNLIYFCLFPIENSFYINWRRDQSWTRK